MPESVDTNGGGDARPRGAPDEGSPRRREQALPAARRFGAWVVWWTLCLSLWLIVTDTLSLAELLTGAGAAALAATVAEVAQHQAATHIRIRIEWAAKALRLPASVATDTVIVFGALVRMVRRGEAPASRFVEWPAAGGDDTPEGVTRRALLVAGRSVSPNTLVLGVDRERDTMVVHELVPPRQP